MKPWSVGVERLASAALLCSTSLLALRLAPRSLSYARAAYRLHLYTGFFSVVHYLAGEEPHPHFLLLLEVSWVWSGCLGLALASAEAVSRTGFPFDLGPLQLAQGASCLLGYHAAGPPLALPALASASAFNLLSLVIISLHLESPLPAAVGALFALNTLWLGGFEQPTELKGIESWSFMASIINVATLFSFYYSYF